MNAPLQPQTKPPSQQVPSFAPAPMRGLLQRKCACGGTPGTDGECAECQSKKRLQAKLTIGASNDPLEHEADRIADQVLAAPAPRSFHSTPPHIQRYTTQAIGLANTAPPSVDQVLTRTGSPLEPALQQDMAQRFGHDFSRVRVHSDAAAEQSAREVNANAYTVGHSIVFGAGRFAPRTHEGRRLIAHELTHVVQQSAPNGIRLGQSNGERGQPPVYQQVEDRNTMQRDLIDDAENLLAAKTLGNLANADLGPPSGFSGDPKCGPNFCQPFTSKAVAAANLAWAGPLLLAGIAAKVNTRVVPLWASYISGGSSIKNLTADFGKDFTASPTTTLTTKFLVAELRKDVEANQATLMGGASTVTVDFTPRLSAALAAIDDPTGPDQMNFNVPSDIAGNVAGGIGKDETSFPIGAKPSPFNGFARSGPERNLDPKH